MPAKKTSTVLQEAVQCGNQTVPPAASVPEGAGVGTMSTWSRSTSSGGSGGNTNRSTRSTRSTVRFMPSSSFPASLPLPEKSRPELRKEFEMEKSRRRFLKEFLEENGCFNVNSEKRGFAGLYEYPLHVAVREANADLVSVLLANGADPYRLDNWGRSPLDLALSKNRKGSHDAIIDVFEMYEEEIIPNKGASFSFSPTVSST